jgi:hypothetical protein
LGSFTCIIEHFFGIDCSFVKQYLRVRIYFEVLGCNFATGLFRLKHSLLHKSCDARQALCNFRYV